MMITNKISCLKCLTTKVFHATRAMSCATDSYETLKVSKPTDLVRHVELNRPDKLNAFTLSLFSELTSCFKTLSTDSSCRAIVLSGSGRLFSAGIDISTLVQISSMCDSDDAGRKAFTLRGIAKDLQESCTALEQCPKPVISVIHNACIGAGVDLVAAADIRYCSQDAWFQIKEVDLGLAADLGTLQRFPKVVGNDSLVRELVYTARKFEADEAMKIGFISKAFSDKDAALKAAIDTASLIAEKSPVAVQTSKTSLVYSRDHSVAEGLDHIATWNQSMLQSEDPVKAATAFLEKSRPTFSNL